MLFDPDFCYRDTYILIYTIHLHSFLNRLLHTITFILIPVLLVFYSPFNPLL